MIRVPERHSKLFKKFVGPRLIVQKLKGNKFEILDPWLNKLDVVHIDRLKRTIAKPDLTAVDIARKCTATRQDNAKLPPTLSHTYNLHYQTA